MSEHTLRAYSGDLADYERFLAREGLDPAVAERAHAARYLDQLAASGARVSTRRRRAVSARRFHSWMRSTGRAQANPFDDLSRPRERRPAPDAIEPADLVRLIETCDGSWQGVRDRALIELAYSAGLRISELLGIDLPHVSLELSEVRVLRKGGREAVLPFGERAAAALSAWLAVRGEHATQALFVSRLGRRLYERTFRYLLRRRAAAAGIGYLINPHMLRHSCASHLHEGGADIATIQELLGHRHISTTMIYTRVSRARIRDAQRRYHPRG